jgi:hypothetical protein
VRYRVWVYSRDRRRWEAKERWRRRRDERRAAVLGNRWLRRCGSWLRSTTWVCGIERDVRKWAS